MLQLKRCCFCLPLKSGCFIISIIYMLLGSLLFLEEILEAIHRFHYMRSENGIGVLFVYDLTDTSLFLFSIFLFYGTYKENRYFVFSGVVLCVSILAAISFSLFHFLLNEMVNFFHYMPPNPEQLLEQFIALIFISYFTLVIWSHHAEMSSRDKRGTAFRNLGTNREGFNQLETNAN